MTQPTTIIGAGLAGLIAAHAWPRALVLEAAPAPRAMHKAVLRFRTQAVANLTGIEFRAVQVRKGLWEKGNFAAPSIRAANHYTQKVLGRLAGDRSVWKLDTVERYIAPEDFYERLVDNLGNRVIWGESVALSHIAGSAGPCVSTAPLPVMAEMCGVKHKLPFERAPIRVKRWRVPGADVFQTVYFTDPWLPLYRASITGDLLIAEYSDAIAMPEDACMIELSAAFGLDHKALEPLDDVRQSYGKIAPVDDAARKALLFQLTHERKIYSLGRFATWRNILLDDVVEDIRVINRLMRTGAAYDVNRGAA